MTPPHIEWDPHDPPHNLPMENETPMTPPYAPPWGMGPLTPPLIGRDPREPPISPPIKDETPRPPPYRMRPLHVTAMHGTPMTPPPYRMGPP